jgi:hypothetical protein
LESNKKKEPVAKTGVRVVDIAKFNTENMMTNLTKKRGKGGNPIKL